MKVSNYGEAPVVIGQYNLDPKEMCFVQYLPIGMSSKEKLSFEVRIPNNLKWTWPIVEQIVEYFGDNYVYLTVKHLYVTSNNMGNRPGWHTDGFGTDDINYIWCDRYPTEFCVQEFKITEDCDASLKEMEAQARSFEKSFQGLGKHPVIASKSLWLVILKAPSAISAHTAPVRRA